MIRVLDKNIADKIAAGEVIERPVSIVKELVENSVDAGANAIVVEIKNGGKSYIRVTDNGSGIAAEEVKVAFLRHATSKIETAEDLASIHTLGFRGEALASIAAVTRTEFVTKPPASKMGVKLLIHGGEIISNCPTGCPDGTTIVVTDLFYNTPARRKFLKSDGSEAGQIIDFMSKIALAYPQIRFRFINNGNIVFSTHGKGELLSTILAVYRQREYEDLVYLAHEKDGNKIFGYISPPSLSRTNRKNQVFFVNGRVVSSKIMERGLENGYRERLFEGRYPVAFLFLETDPAGLDVNIHPNKKEVRFDQESEIQNLLTEAVKMALGTDQAVTEIKNVFASSDEIKKGERTGDEKQVDIKQILSTKRQESLQVSEEIKSPLGTLADSPKIQNDIASSSEIESSAVSASPHKPQLSLQASVLRPFEFSDLMLTGSIFDTYITAVDEKNFYLIDQHAAHERIFYEKLVREYLSDEKLRQLILTPVVIDVPLEVKENEYDWLNFLTDIGFLIEEFGQNSYVIREIPTFMTISEAEQFVEEFIDGLSDGKMLRNTVVINKLITKSCKSAVKAHDHLSMEEMKALIEQLSVCENPFSCPHGRPTFIRISQYEIEKMFKRV